MTSKAIPTTAKGSMRTVEVACAAWIDLLGYGAMLEAASFDVTDPRMSNAINRLEEFQRVVAAHSCRYLPTFVMNDGAVAYRDLSPRSISVTYDIVSRAYKLFLSVNQCDMDRLGFPGARMVIASGFRLRRPLSFRSFLDEGKAKSIKTRLEAGQISQEQAINEALKTRNTHDTTPELQGNFAMTKAYLADSTGKAGGLGGPSCYIDMAFFDSEPPAWIRFRRIIEWQSRGLSARFGEIETIDNVAASAARHVGIRSAFSVARELSPARDIGAVLKSGRVTRSR